MRLVPFLLCALVALSACTDGFVSFPVTKDAQESLGDDVEIIRLDASNIASFSSPAQGHQTSAIPSGQGWDYKVGVGDILSVIVHASLEDGSRLDDRELRAFFNLLFPAGAETTRDWANSSSSSTSKARWPVPEEVSFSRMSRTRAAI